MRGFSLIEVLLTTALMGVLLSITFFSSQPSRGGEVRAAAERIVEELKLARNKAMTTGEPVGFAIPNLADSSGFYLLEGQINPQVTEQRVISADHQGVHLCPVHWPGPNLTAASSLDLNMEFGGFDWTQWNPPAPNDYILVFLPTGAVLSNKLAFDNSYHFLVSNGSLADSASVAGISSWSLRSVNEAYTVTVAPTGHISADRGVESGPSISQDKSLSYDNEVMNPASKQGNTSPYDLSIEVFPKPNANAAALGVDATVDENGFLTLKAQVQDDQADQLRCEWTCQEAAGSFSCSQPMEMEWNGDANLWEAAWEWYPPKPDLVGEYTLSCTVTDGRGGSVNGLIPVNGRVKVLHQGKIAYASNETGSFDIYTCNPDGTDIVNLTRSPGSDQRSPSWSPDGRKITFVSDESGIFQVHRINSDGSEPIQVTASPGGKYLVSVSPDGTKIAWIRFVGPGGDFQQLFTADFDGQNETLVYDFNGLANTMSSPSFSLDNETIFLSGGLSARPIDEKYQDPVSELWKVNADGSGLKQLTNFPTRVMREIDVSRIDGRIASFSFGGGSNRFYIGDYDPTSETLNLTEQPFTGFKESPRWSPSGNGELVVQEYTGPGSRNLWIVDGTTGQNLRQLIDNPGGAMMDDAAWGIVNTAP